MAVIVGLAVLSGAAPVGAQQVTLRADREAVSVDEEVTLEVRATGEFDDLVPPPTPGLEVTGRSQSSQVSIMGRQMTREQVVTLVLTPTRGGVFTIGPAELRRGGTTVARSATLTLTVREVAATPQSATRAGDLRTRGGEPLFLAPILPQRPVYAGEPFVLTFALYIRGDVQAESASWKRPPEFPGFSAADLLQGGSAGRPRRERIGNQTYYVSVQSRHLLVPLQAGAVRIEGASMDVIVGDIFARRRSVVRTPPLDVEVRPVPEAGRPAEYEDGNIGRFELAAEVRPTEVQAGERVLYTLRISGQGNLEALKAPELPALEGVEVEAIPASDADKIEKTAAGISGTRVFQWVLVPQREGPLAIPALRFGYFDPDAGRFQVATTASMSVRVEGTAPVATGPAAVAPAGEELRDIRADSDLRSHRPRPPHATLWFWLVLGATTALVALVELAAAIGRRRARNAGWIRMRRARSEAEKALRSASATARDGGSAALFGEVARTLHRFCEDRFGFGLTGRTHDAVRRALLDVGADDQLADDVTSELENCDYGRFAPVSVREDEMRGSLDRARALVTRLDRLPGRRRTTEVGP